MYFTSLPDHTHTGFDAQEHFNKFKKYNIIFNARTSKSYCDEHVGCLSFKTVLKGEEWYGIGNQQKAVRPGQFLILNDDQPYSSWIDTDDSVQSLSIFFKKEFASSVFYDALNSDGCLLNDPFQPMHAVPEFFQTLYNNDSTLQKRLMYFISQLNIFGYHADRIDEDLIFLLHHLLRAHHSEARLANCVSAVKPVTRIEIYKRLCIARDFMHSSFMDNPDLKQIGNTACLSVPQLVRQFKAVFKATPHHYLRKIRLSHAAALLKHTDKTVDEIISETGFENTS